VAGLATETSSPDYRSPRRPHDARGSTDADRGPVEEIRRRITADLQKDIEQTYRALLQQLTTHFAALRPINDHLLELRHRHYQTSTLLMHVPSWGELSPNVVNGVPSKMAAWLAHAPPRLHVCVRAFKKFNFGRLTQITRMDGAERKEVC
jgi:hypothetical protein